MSKLDILQIQETKIKDLQKELAKLKSGKETLKWTASNVDKKKSKRDTLILQFTLTIELPDGSALTIRNCIAGVSEKGPWATPPLDKWKTITINKKAQENLISAFQSKGLLDGLEPNWTEEEKVEIKWTT